MFRRIVSILVLLGFIAGQSAVMPHAHGGLEPVGHDATPHIHLSLHHSHSHCHGSHKHSHHSHQPSPAGQLCKAVVDHDADAIYLPTVTPFVERGSDELSGLQIQFALLLTSVAIDLSAADAQQASFGHHPQDICAPNCALYLQLRALRI